MAWSIGRKYLGACYAMHLTPPNPLKRRLATKHSRLYQGWQGPGVRPCGHLPNRRASMGSKLTSLSGGHVSDDGSEHWCSIERYGIIPDATLISSVASRLASRRRWQPNIR